MTVRRSGNCKAAKTEMVWARDKTGRPNQSDITGNSRRQSNKRQAEKRVGLTTSPSGPANPSQRLCHGTQPAGVERPDGKGTMTRPRGSLRS